MSDTSLLPCPFCGGEASTFEDYGHSSAWNVGCFNGNCRVEPHVWEETKAEAITAWNNRTIPAVQPTVKPLAWQFEQDDVQVADTSARHQYRIVLDRRATVGAWMWFCDGKWICLETEEAAKAASQADYEARIMSALDMQPTVKPDVAALDEVYDTMMEVQRNPTGAWQAIQDQADAITTLHAQLAEARAEFATAKKDAGILCEALRRAEVAFAKHRDRADRAEAALATVFGDGLRTAICVIASIGYGKNEDVDAGHEEALRAVEKYLTDWTSRSQPHDRTALDRMMAEAREKALREAAAEAERTGTCLLPSGHFLSERCRDAILALITKGDCVIEKPDAP